ncbi:MAG: ricin-type beta-trefoil lectin domain protein [Deltaproteobacteria bacterium]|nr:ricin-type beta-trefoil lectin domain protein [Deltaproteobacteria bacterium]
MSAFRTPATPTTPSVYRHRGGVIALMALLVAGCLTHEPAPKIDGPRRSHASRLEPESPLWGYLEGGDPVKGVYFFPGDAGVDGPGVDRFSYLPLDSYHRRFTESAAIASWTIDQITALGANVMMLSYWYHPWGQHCDRADKQYCDDVWTSVLDKPIKIIPAIDGFAHREHFGKPGDSTLLDMIDSAVQRWLVYPANPYWPNKWQQMYDRSGELRYAVELIELASDFLPFGDRDSMFVQALDDIATAIELSYGIKIGFVVDPGTRFPTPPEGLFPGTYSPEPGLTRFENANSFLGIMGWRNEAQTPGLQFCDEYAPGCDNNLAPNLSEPPDHYRETVARSKRTRTEAWIANGLPTILDVSPGYDGHLPWEAEGKKHGYIGDNSYGYDDRWRNYLSAFKGIGNRGIFLTSWNGYTEGMAVMPGMRKQGVEESSAVDDGYWNSTRYDWAQRLYQSDPRVCDYWHFVSGLPAFNIDGDICQHWQALGGQLGLYGSSTPRFGEPVTSVVPSPGGNNVARFALTPPQDFFGFYFKNSAIGAHEVHGAIYAKYRNMLEDASFLGVPVTDELDSTYWCSGGRYNAFEHGWIDWCPDGRVWAHSLPNEAWPGHEVLVGPGMVKGYPSSTKCLSVQYDIFQGALITTWDCVNGANQQWYYDENLKFIRSVYDPTKCLDIYSFNPNNGAAVVAWPCSGTLNEQWDYVGGAFRSRMQTPSPKCLTASYNTANGTPLVSWDCSGFANQQFTLPGQ